MRFLIIGFFIFINYIISEPPQLHKGNFSEMIIEDEIIGDWKPMNFRGLKPTTYSLYDLNGKVVVKAESDNSSSGLVRRTDVNLSDYPKLSWEWKVTSIYEKGNVFEKKGDDYPARIYVIFDYDISNLSWLRRNQIRALRIFYGEIPTRAINYIHDSQAEMGTTVENPYTELVTMVVVESGEENLNRLVQFERNVFEDYVKIYGENPPNVVAIAIMTDSDDTGESTVTYFGDIYFNRSK